MRTFELKNINDLKIEDNKIVCIADVKNSDGEYKPHLIKFSIPDDITLNFIGKDGNRQGFLNCELKEDAEGAFVIFSELHCKEV